MESILVILLFIIIVIWMSSRKPAKFPPGPPRWPVLGNILEICKWGSTPHLATQEIYKRYGEVAGFFVGNSPVVLISGLVPIHEVSHREDLAGRIINPYKMFNVKGELYGITPTSGEKSEEHREFALKNLGNGLRNLEEIAQNEIVAVFEGMEHIKDGRKESLATPVQDILGMAILNVLLYLIIGKRYDHSNSTLRKLMHNVKKMLSLSDVSGGLFVVLPLNQQPLLSSSKRSRVEHLYSWLQYFFQEEFDQHKKSFESNVTRDYLDAYIAEMMEQINDQESTFTEKQLVSSCFEILVAGTTTTFNTLAFALLYMVLYPEIQIKVQEELDRVVGSDRLPALEDRPKLSYTEATLLEVFRKSCVLPLSVPHACLTTEKEVKFREYIIPKNARVILNIYGLHHDTRVWIDPVNFRPGRFLNEEGKVVGHDAFMPFGVGKRSCVGESVAHNTLLLFFAALMQRYTIKVPSGASFPSEEPAGNFLLAPKRFSVQMVSRFSSK